MTLTPFDNKWDARFLAMAQLVSTWSRDPSTKVGAVIVRPNRTIAALGYNGFARGVDDTDTRLQNRDLRIALTVHAEANAILNAHERLNNCTLYTTFPPCAMCAGLAIQAGLARVVSEATIPRRWVENMEVARVALKEGGVRADYVLTVKESE